MEVPGVARGSNNPFLPYKLDIDKVEKFCYNIYRKCECSLM